MNYKYKTDSLYSTEMYNKLKGNQIKSVDVFMGFEDGVSKEKLKKIEMRKDAILLLNLKEKYEMSEERRNQLKAERELERAKKLPYYKLHNGKNLFSMSVSKLRNLPDVFEMSYKELDEFDMDFIANLPNLNKLDVKLSNILYGLKDGFHLFFPSLLNLTLSFSNLKNEIFIYLNNVPSLKTLNLSGNKITGEIPDLKQLQHLEELNLSYNDIESFFVNLPAKIEDVIKEDIKNENSMNSNEDINEQINCMEVHNVMESQPILSDITNKNFDENLGQQSKENFEEWQEFLKTNLQDFFHNISQLPKLEILNLSQNKIHFFDINPFFIQQSNGFRKLTQIDFSNNLIEEEIAILLIMNIPQLNWLDISNNPITKNKTAFENIEYEIYKNKNVLLVNSKNPNSIENRRKPKNSTNKNIEDLYEKQKPYRIRKDNVGKFTNFDKMVKKKIAEIFERQNKIIPDFEDDDNDNESFDLVDTNDNQDKLTLDMILKNKKSDDLFITNDPTQINNNKCVNTYDKFLGLAKKCFGKEKHYKQKISIPNAYQQLRFILSSLQTEAKQEKENVSYLMSTIAHKIYKEGYSPSSDADKENYLKEMKLLSKMTKANVRSSNSFFDEK